MKKYPNISLHSKSSPIDWSGIDPIYTIGARFYVKKT